jgi:hypothetical protein
MRTLPMPLLSAIAGLLTGVLSPAPVGAQDCVGSPLHFYDSSVGVELHKPDRGAVYHIRGTQRIDQTLFASGTLSRAVLAEMRLVEVSRWDGSGSQTEVHRVEVSGTGSGIAAEVIFMWPLRQIQLCSLLAGRYGTMSRHHQESGGEDFLELHEVGASGVAQLIGAGTAIRLPMASDAELTAYANGKMSFGGPHIEATTGVLVRLGRLHLVGGLRQIYLNRIRCYSCLGGRRHTRSAPGWRSER